jgi:hypothetical protein
MPTIDRVSLIRALAFAGTMALIWTVRPAAAMTFATQPDRDGRQIVVGTGKIESGDSERLRKALKGAGRDGFGHKTLSLDSPGGSVGEAFAMVAVMDQEQVSTIVAGGATCASACAQILFLSGVHRVVTDGGRLGLHSCHDPKDRSRSMACNEAIAQNALARGTPYGSILAFMHFTAPAQVRWLDSREADCWGFTQWPPGSGRGVKKGDAAPCILKPTASTSGWVMAAADRDDWEGDRPPVSPAGSPSTPPG